MKQTMFLTMTLAATIGLAGTAYAGPPASKTAPAKKPATAASVPANIACAVETGNKVDVKKATASKMYADYKGNRYFFCCDGCPAAFKANPEKYAKNAHIKTPSAPAPTVKKS